MYLSDIPVDTKVKLGVYCKTTNKMKYYDTVASIAAERNHLTTTFYDKELFIEMNLVDGAKVKIEIVTPQGVIQWHTKVVAVREVASVLFVTFYSADNAKPADRRNALRLPFVTDMMYYVRGNPRYVASRNISLKGIGFATMHEHRVGEILSMTVAIGETTGVCAGKVVRVEAISKTTYMVGVEFNKELPKELAELVKTMNQKAIDDYKDNTWV